HLANVKFFLKDDARIWWRNVEDSVTSFEQFCTLFLKVYGNKARNSQHAAKILNNRVQRQNETCFAYVQEILRLCRQVDPAMAEPTKVKHILRGIAKSVFWILAIKGVKTVAEVLDAVHDVDTMLASRIDESPIEQLSDVIDIPSYSPTDSDESSEADSEESVPFRLPCRRRKKQKKPPVGEASSSSLREIVTQVVKEVLATQPPAVPVATVARTPSPRRIIPQNRRTCWICHSPRHIQRFCPHRTPNHFYSPHPSFNPS